MLTAEQVEHFRARVLQDALAQATASYWLRRAEQFEAALPRPSDDNGQATPAELTERAQRLSDTALACRRHAALLRADPPAEWADEVAQVLAA